jgi:hypothetical protein
MWPEADGMATVLAYLPAAEATGVYAALDEYARRAGGAGNERSMDARRADALVDLMLQPAGFTRAATTDPAGNTRTGSSSQYAGATTGCRCACVRCRRGGGVDVRVTIPYTALLGADELPVSWPVTDQSRLR